MVELACNCLNLRVRVVDDTKPQGNPGTFGQNQPPPPSLLKDVCGGDKLLLSLLGADPFFSTLGSLGDGLESSDLLELASGEGSQIVSGIQSLVKKRRLGAAGSGTKWTVQRCLHCETDLLAICSTMPSRVLVSTKALVSICVCMQFPLDFAHPRYSLDLYYLVQGKSSAYT